MKREISLLQATSINMIDMVGIGPFVTLSIVISIVGSNLFLWAWVFGAVTAVIDGMIWSELGTAYPLAGGSYNFLKEAYAPGADGSCPFFLYGRPACNPPWLWLLGQSGLLSVSITLCHWVFGGRRLFRGYW
jgi:amino acid transporter